MEKRDYREGDEEKIISLFGKVFGKNIDLDFWRWKYHTPFGQGTIKLMFDGKELVGHYAVLPMALLINDEPVKACLSVDTMIHPDYRNQGLFTELANETYQTVISKGVRLVYGFPNGNSYHGFTKCLGWTGLGKVVMWQKEIDTLHNLKFNWRRIKRVNQFADDWNTKYAITVPRTKDFLNWRFVLNPRVHYAKFILSEGYCVLKIYERKGHIVDMVAHDEAIMIELLHCAYDYFKKRDISNVSCWCYGDDLMLRVVKKEGFSPVEMPTHFGFRVFDDLKLPEEWHLSMADTDVF